MYCMIRYKVHAPFCACTTVVLVCCLNVKPAVHLPLLAGLFFQFGLFSLYCEIVFDIRSDLL